MCDNIKDTKIKEAKTPATGLTRETGLKKFMYNLKVFNV